MRSGGCDQSKNAWTANRKGEENNHVYREIRRVKLAEGGEVRPAPPTEGKEKPAGIRFLWEELWEGLRGNKQ